MANIQMALIWDSNLKELPLSSPQPREVGVPSLMQKARGGGGGAGAHLLEEASETCQSAGQCGLTESCSVWFCAKRIGGGRVGRQRGPLETE